MNATERQLWVQLEIFESRVNVMCSRARDQLVGDPPVVVQGLQYGVREGGEAGEVVLANPGFYSKLQ